MNGLKSKRKLQYLAGFDHADMERKASLARMSGADEELLRAFREEDKAGAQMLGAAVAVSVFVAGVALVLWAMPDIVSWMVGQPAIVVNLR